MSKRNRNISKHAINRRIKEGRGQGYGKDDVPWLQIQDVPSKGKTSRLNGWKTDRVHHLLSTLETQYFYNLEWSSIVTDIREQHPLDQDKTLYIAENLGIKHPTDPRTREPIVMTTDFVITINQSSKFVDQARSIKYSKDLLSKRTLEKLEIERIYWSEENIDWGIVTEKEVDTVLANNVSWVHSYRDIADLCHVTTDILRRVEAFLTPLIIEQRIALKDITYSCDDQLGISKEVLSLSIVRYLIANKRWKVDMRQKIDTAKPLALITEMPQKP